MLTRKEFAEQQSLANFILELNKYVEELASRGITPEQMECRFRVDGEHQHCGGFSDTNSSEDGERFGMVGRTLILVEYQDNLSYVEQA